MTVAAKRVFGARSLVGVKVMVVPTKLTVPGTTVEPGPVTFTFAVLMVVGSIASLNVAAIEWFRQRLLQYPLDQ